MGNDFTITELRAKKYTVRMWNAFLMDFTLEWEFKYFGEALAYARCLSAIYEADSFRCNEINRDEFQIHKVISTYETQMVGYVENCINETILCVDDDGEFWLPIIETDFVDCFC